MSRKTTNLVIAAVAGLIVAMTGALEDWFGRFDYAGDAISYLEIARAFRISDFHLALSPYWSIGYPLIIATVEPLFPPGPLGEWTCVHVINLVIFICTYLSFLYLLKIAEEYAAAVFNGSHADRHELSQPMFLIGTTIFLLMQLTVGNISRVSPDLLVSAMFFLLAAWTLRFFLHPNATTAAMMGLIMGLGFIFKSIFLPILVVFFLIAIAQSLRRPRLRVTTFARLLWAPLAMFIIVAPYITAISVNLGQFTLGETGKLNYAWNVNHLPRWYDWQGGPPPNGQPIHPPRLAFEHPPVFEFAGPFHVAYPPWFNPYYYYEGFQPYFSLQNQLEALKQNLIVLRRFLLHEAPIWIIALALLTVILCVRDIIPWLRRLFALWPLYLPSFAAIGVYLLVFIEPRYVVGFLTLLLVVPFIPLFAPTPLLSPKIARGLIAVMMVLSLALLLHGQRPLIHRVLHGETYVNSEQWRTGLSLAPLGILPGTKVAAVRTGDTMYNTWAYVGGVRIVAEVGNDAYDPENQDADFHLFTSDPATQQTVLDVFRQAGAKAAVVLNSPTAPAGDGWQQIPGTQSWVRLL